MAACLLGLLASSCVTPSTVEDISQSHWALRGPKASDYSTVFPASAYNRRISGAARLLCTILADRTLDCTVASETPPGEGFGAAAMTLSHAYVVRSMAEDARLATGSRIVVPFRFVNPN
jgi:protein TonB